MLGKNKTKGSVAETEPASEAPPNVREPKVTVRKQWQSGRVSVTSEGGFVTILDAGEPGCRIGFLEGRIGLSASSCAWLADVLLQAHESKS